MNPQARKDVARLVSCLSETNRSGDPDPTTAALAEILDGAIRRREAMMTLACLVVALVEADAETLHCDPGTLLDDLMMRIASRE